MRDSCVDNPMILPTWELVSDNQWDDDNPNYEPEWGE